MAKFVFQERGTGRGQIINTRFENDARYLLTEEQEIRGETLADRLMIAKQRWTLLQTER